MRSSLAERGHGPTVREIGSRVGLSSTSWPITWAGSKRGRLVSRTGRKWSTCVLSEAQSARPPGLRSREPGAGTNRYERRPAA
ncbi:hypothetical protein [Streptomyces sp. NPDC007094]|uniref:LexA family protein n=1 Tax=Streptomyces sp. NPDC007094 TaxID=3155359 RepID=UPI0033F25362